jgi:diguanylate cyclase (GGDEF)-like protein
VCQRGEDGGEHAAECWGAQRLPGAATVGCDERVGRGAGICGLVEERTVAPEQLANVLGEFARTMVTDFPIQGILDHLVKRIVEIMPVSAAGVTLISPGLEPRYVAASDQSALRYEKLQSSLGEGPCLAAYHTGEAVAVPYLSKGDRFPKFAPEATQAGLGAVFTFPLNHGDLRLGALDLYRDTAGDLSAQSMGMAQTLADVAAAYLINAQARSDLQDSSDQSREASLHDALTGLPNRVLMLERLAHAFRRGDRSGLTTAVFFMDLDEFKMVNDTYGHQVGDELLVAVAERLSGVLRPGDSLGRLSGDEFVVLCEDLEDPSEADLIAVRFDEAFADPFALSGVELQIDASIGIAFTGRGSDAPEQLIHDADLAMYRTKRHRDRDHGVLDLRELHLAEHQAGLARALPGAAKRNELRVEYQPIVDTLDGHPVGMEALLRWTHPSRGAVPPTMFIPFAEHSGQIVELGRWVLQQACSDRDAWQNQSPEQLGLSVNVSSHQFMSVGFAHTVAAILDATRTDPGMVTLEVTERVFIHDEDRALIVLSDLKDIGVKLALDDFGTGYSSLGYLDTLPIDTIKIDQTFIAKLADPRRHTIVNSIIELAHGLGMTVTAEGVETAERHDALTRLGADACQGFYFARPMSAHAINTLIGHGPTTLPPAA